MGRGVGAAGEAEGGGEGVGPSPGGGRSRTVRRLVVLAVGVLVVLVGVVELRRPRPRAVLRMATGPVYRVQFSLDSARVAASGADRTVGVWDVSSGRLSWVSGPNEGFVEALAFSPDGSMLASLDRRGWTLQDAATGEVLETLGAKDRPAWCRVEPLVSRASPGERYRVEEVAGPWPVRTLTVRSEQGGQRVTLDGHPDQLNCARFALGNPTATPVLITGGGSTDHPWPVNASGDLRFWDARTGRLLRRLQPHWGAIRDVEVSPDGRTLATAGDGAVMLWDLDRLLRSMLVDWTGGRAQAPPG